MSVTRRSRDVRLLSARTRQMTELRTTHRSVSAQAVPLHCRGEIELTHRAALRVQIRLMHGRHRQQDALDVPCRMRPIDPYSS